MHLVVNNIHAPNLAVVIHSPITKNDPIVATNTISNFDVNAKRFLSLPTKKLSLYLLIEEFSLHFYIFINLILFKIV